MYEGGEIDLASELNKLININNEVRLQGASFCIGYLTYSIPFLSISDIQTIRDKIDQAFLLMADQMITLQNILEIMVMLKFKVLSENKKNVAMRIDQSFSNYITQLALDNMYLYRKYFDKYEIQRRQLEEEVRGIGIECPICLQQIAHRQLSILSCNHMFHQYCFNEYAKEKILNKLLPLVCPEEDCNRQIYVGEIQQYLNRQVREKYEEFTFQNYVQSNMQDTSWCPTPGCKAVFTFDENLEEYRCPACKKHYCLRCRCEMHTGITCAQYRELSGLGEDQKKFMMLVKASKYKQCPSCKFWVEKNQGCDHMTCRCKYQFCYVCGGTYQKCKCTGYNGPIEVVAPIVVPIPPPLPILRPPIPPVRAPAVNRPNIKQKEKRRSPKGDILGRAFNKLRGKDKKRDTPPRQFENLILNEDNNIIGALSFDGDEQFQGALKLSQLEKSKREKEFAREQSQEYTMKRIESMERKQAQAQIIYALERQKREKIEILKRQQDQRQKEEIISKRVRLQRQKEKLMMLPRFIQNRQKQAQKRNQPLGRIQEKYIREKKVRREDYQELRKVQRQQLSKSQQKILKLQRNRIE